MNFRLKFPDLCDRCGRPGHWGGQCEEPLDAAHYNLIAVLVDLWSEGKITVGDKRDAIAQENKRYHGTG